MKLPHKILFGFILLILFITSSTLYLIGRTTQNIPIIVGKIIPGGKHIENFSLLDHHGKKFDNHDLLDQWHLLSYGYTSCPDICPTTLRTLSKMNQQLKAQPNYADLQFVFYTIDHKRDTSEYLAEYLNFFDTSFKGLTYLSENQSIAQTFEKSIGIKAKLTPLPEEERNDYSGDYSVAHGVMLFLIGPNAKLQAVFKPQRSTSGIQYYSSEQLLQDYLAVRKNFDQNKPAAEKLNEIK